MIQSKEIKSTKIKEIGWTEPTFFKARYYATKGWIIRGILFLSIYLAFFAVTFIGNSRHEPIGNTFRFLFPAIMATLFVVLYEVENSSRRITLSENMLSYNGSFPLFFGGLIHLFSMGNWNKREIKHVLLLRPDEEGNQFPFGLMIVTRKYAGEKTFGIPTSIPFEQIANQLHSMDIEVELSDWKPINRESEEQKS